VKRYDEEKIKRSILDGKIQVEESLISTVNEVSYALVYFTKG
jgi:hypothetical protein